MDVSGMLIIVIYLNGLLRGMSSGKKKYFQIKSATWNILKNIQMPAGRL